MNPNQPDRSIDYLNQIAPQSKPPLFGNKWLPIGLGAVLFLAIVVIVIGTLNRTPDLTTQTTNLYARLQTLETLATDQQKNLKDSKLRSSNSSLALLLNTASSDLSNYLKGTKTKFQVPAEMQKSERAYLASLSDKLNDARLNVELDSTYAREMAYQLNVIHSLMNSIARKNPSAALIKVLVETNDNLEPLRETFSSFSGAKE